MKAPPEYGTLSLRLDQPPVSLQSSALRKSQVKDAVTALCTDFAFLLTGEVKVFIEWHVSEIHRYETNISADVDNIVKPLLDGLCGPTGLLVDDSQVQEISCSWNDIGVVREFVRIEVKYSPDEFYSKANIVFVHVSKSLYFPMPRDISVEARKNLFSVVLRSFATMQKGLALGIPPLDARVVLPCQRMFHKGRIKRFTKLTPERFYALPEAV